MYNTKFKALGIRPSVWQTLQTVNNTSFQDTRTRVLRAATELFAEQGYVHSSLDKVAFRAGLSKGAVYWHFSSKQDLFLVILEQNLSQELHMLSSQIEAVLSVENPLNAINTWLEMLFDCLESGSFMLFMEFITTSREPEVQKRLHEIEGFMERYGT